VKKRIIVEKLFHEKNVSGASRVSANVDGKPFWYESSDSELVISPEGFANALLCPAMSLGRDLYFEDPLSEVWLNNIQKVIEQYSLWLGWKRIKIESGSTEAAIKKTGNSRALCFSGGVDSFHSLLTYPQHIDKLITVHGYDIRLDDTDGAKFTYENTKKVAAAKGMDSVLIRTNYLDHHIAGRKYRYSFGGALSAIGFLVSGVNELVISSGEAFPSGSHSKIDPLRSSADVKIIHYGNNDLTRDDKFRAIASEPLLKKHLHVCQQNLHQSFDISDNSLNCGRCIKCVQTLLVLQQEAGIDDLEGFANKKNLDAYLYNEPYVRKYFFKSYNEIIRRGVDKPTELAIRALIRRSRILNKFAWAGRTVTRAMFSILRQYDSIERKIFCTIK
jgi:hypothetical protein